MLAICTALASLLAGRAAAQDPALPTGPRTAEVDAAATEARAATADSPSLDLDQVIERVLRGNPTLQALRQDEDAARALERQAAPRPNPVLSYDDQRVPSGNRAYAASLSIPLEIAGQRAARMDAAQASTRAVGSDVGQRSAELRAAAIQAFFDVVGAQDRLELAQGRASSRNARRRSPAAASPPAVPRRSRRRGRGSPRLPHGSSSARRPPSWKPPGYDWRRCGEAASRASSRHARWRRDCPSRPLPMSWPVGSMLHRR